MYYLDGLLTLCSTLMKSARTAMVMGYLIVIAFALFSESIVKNFYNEENTSVRLAGHHDI